MIKWEVLADQKTIDKTVASLKRNGIEAQVVKNIREAKKKILELLPSGAQVMTMTSMTLEAIGLDKAINDSGKFNSVRNQLMKLDREKNAQMMRQLGAAPDWAIGSIGAVTVEGQVLIASATGSQLPAYAYSGGNIIWVVGTQKIVKNLQEGLRRIYEYSYPLEDARAQKAYGMGSGVNKILIVNKEVQPGRITLIFVKEKLGF